MDEDYLNEMNEASDYAMGAYLSDGWGDLDLHAIYGEDD